MWAKLWSKHRVPAGVIRVMTRERPTVYTTRRPARVHRSSRGYTCTLRGLPTQTCVPGTCFDWLSVTCFATRDWSQPSIRGKPLPSLRAPGGFSEGVAGVGRRGTHEPTCSRRLRSRVCPNLRAPGGFETYLRAPGGFGKLQTLLAECLYTAWPTRVI